MAFLYEFHWDAVKAQANMAKHGVDFQRAATVFRDPLAITIPDEEHSLTEARWITLGKDIGGRYLLVIHTFEWLTPEQGRVRLFRQESPLRQKFVTMRHNHET